MACKVLVVAEQEGGAVRAITWELLGLAHKVASEAGWDAGSVKALLIGSGLDAAADQVAKRGAAEVIAADAPALANYTCDGYDAVIEAQAKAEQPALVLFGHTP